MILHILFEDDEYIFGIFFTSGFGVRGTEIN